MEAIQLSALRRQAMFQFVVAVEIVDGEKMFVVRRKDKKSFNNGIMGYNFDLNDRAAADALRWKLEAEAV
jgi:hypothetical protein